MKVLLTAQSVLPSHAGVAVVVSRLGFALADWGVTVGIWTPDNSPQRSSLVASHPNLHALEGPLATVLKQFGAPDIIHDSGIWMPANHQLANLSRRRQIPRLVSLHGMLLPRAFAVKKWKKLIAWRLFQKRDLTTAQRLHATSESEAQSACDWGLRVPVSIVPNGVDLPDLQEGHTRTNPQGRDGDGRRVALFLGRLHPIKGLPMLIEAWARVRPKEWILYIGGPDEGGHRAELQAMIDAEQLSDQVVFLGPVSADQKHSVFEIAELFVLPTHSENFGLVVGEALANEIPVLTTKGAPWDLLESWRCGWWVDASVSGITEGLHLATSCDTQSLRKMGERGRNLVLQKFSWKEVAGQFAAIYLDMSR